MTGRIICKLSAAVHVRVLAVGHSKRLCSNKQQWRLGGCLMCCVVAIVCRPTGRCHGGPQCQHTQLQMRPQRCAA